MVETHMERDSRGCLFGWALNEPWPGVACNTVTLWLLYIPIPGIIVNTYTNFYCYSMCSECMVTLVPGSIGFCCG